MCPRQNPCVAKLERVPERLGFVVPEPQAPRETPIPLRCHLQPTSRFSTPPSFKWFDSERHKGTAGIESGAASRDERRENRAVGSDVRFLFLASARVWTLQRSKLLADLPIIGAPVPPSCMTTFLMHPAAPPVLYTLRHSRHHYINSKACG